MQIKEIPENYASLCEPLRYTFADTAPRTFDVKIVTGSANKAVGMKRLTGVAKGEVDAAPFLRRKSVFRPQTGQTAFLAATQRSVTAGIQIGDTTSEKRIFVPTAAKYGVPSLATTFTGIRQIGPSDCDELTLLTATAPLARVQYRKAGTTYFKEYQSLEAGFLLFRLNTADFPGAEAIHIVIEGVSMVSYSLADYKAGRRLAWRSSVGSVEHYTFPVVKDSHAATEKEQTLTDTGHRTGMIRSTQLTTLLSAYEPGRTLEPLAEILASPDVWSVENGVYVPVQVVNAGSGIRRHGTLRNLEVQIACAPQTLLP